MRVACLAADTVLAQLVRDAAAAKPAACQKKLCAAGYDTKRKEMMNFRNLRHEAARSAAIEELGLDEMLAAAAEMRN